MSRIVRVRRNGAEFNVGAAHAKANEFEVLDESPHDRGGNLKATTRAGGRPRKPKTSVSQEAAKKKAAPSAETSDNTPSKEA